MLTLATIRYKCYQKMRRRPPLPKTRDYTIMLFGLKNTGATYQRLVNKIFTDMIRKTMEVYVDDMLVRSLRKETYIKYLKKMFGKLSQ